MATYVYETIPKKAGQKPRQFEYEQSMKDAPLTKCPKTGDPVKRVITGGTIITRGTSILSMNRPKSSVLAFGSCGYTESCFIFLHGAMLK